MKITQDSPLYHNIRKYWNDPNSYELLKTVMLNPNEEEMNKIPNSETPFNAAYDSGTEENGASVNDNLPVGIWLSKGVESKDKVTRSEIFPYILEGFKVEDGTLKKTRTLEFDNVFLAATQPVVDGRVNDKDGAFVWITLPESFLAKIPGAMPDKELDNDKDFGRISSPTIIKFDKSKMVGVSWMKDEDYFWVRAKVDWHYYESLIYYEEKRRCSINNEEFDPNKLGLQFRLSETQERAKNFKDPPSVLVQGSEEPIKVNGGDRYAHPAEAPFYSYPGRENKITPFESYCVLASVRLRANCCLVKRSNRPDLYKGYELMTSFTLICGEEICVVVKGEGFIIPNPEMGDNGVAVLRRKKLNTRMSEVHWKAGETINLFAKSKSHQDMTRLVGQSKETVTEEIMKERIVFSAKLHDTLDDFVSFNAPFRVNCAEVVGEEGSLIFQKICSKYGISPANMNLHKLLFFLNVYGYWRGYYNIEHLCTKNNDPATLVSISGVRNEKYRQEWMWPHETKRELDIKLTSEEVEKVSNRATIPTFKPFFFGLWPSQALAVYERPSIRAPFKTMVFIQSYENTGTEAVIKHNLDFKDVLVLDSMQAEGHDSLIYKPDKPTNMSCDLWVSLPKEFVEYKLERILRIVEYSHGSSRGIEDLETYYCHRRESESTVDSPEIESVWVRLHAHWHDKDYQGSPYVKLMKEGKNSPLTCLSTGKFIDPHSMHETLLGKDQIKEGGKTLRSLRCDVSLKIIVELEDGTKSSYGHGRKPMKVKFYVDERSGCEIVTRGEVVPVINPRIGYATE